MGIICFFKGHEWKKIDESYVPEHDFDNPMLWEPPHVIVELGCSRCGEKTTANHVEWWPGLYSQITGPKK